MDAGVSGRRVGVEGLEIEGTLELSDDGPAIEFSSGPRRLLICLGESCTRRVESSRCNADNGVGECVWTGDGIAKAGTLLASGCGDDVLRGGNEQDESDALALGGDGENGRVGIGVCCDC